ncbi:unnamed protein product, partial [marine sediment metagenome]
DKERLDHTGEYYIGASTELREGDRIIFYYLCDHDADSLTDRLEYALGTNPYDKDTDHDGLIDCAEFKVGTNPNNPNSDYSQYEALDGWEIDYLSRTDRVPVGLATGDTIQVPRNAWDTYLSSSPVEEENHFDFVSYPYKAPDYDSRDDDKYMDWNINGIPDWREHYFADPTQSWNAKTMITWDGEQTVWNPYGYQDNRFEYGRIKYFPDTDIMCGRIDMGGNGVLEIVFKDESDGVDTKGNSYAYFKLFNADFKIDKNMTISYNIQPKTNIGKRICIDLIFSNNTRALTDTAFKDFNGVRMHPAFRKDGNVDGWHHVSASLEPFVGKEVKTILIGYEDNPNSTHGKVHTYIDNLCIRGRNIILTFEDKTAPKGGFPTDEFVELQGFRFWNSDGDKPECGLRSLSAE